MSDLLNAIAPKIMASARRYAEVKFGGRNNRNFDTSTPYTFNSDIEGLQIGDTVVCDCTTGLAVGEVVNFLAFDSSGKSSRWIVQKVDLKVHSERLEKQAERERIRGLMDMRKKQLEDEALYRMMAERDPEMAKLIALYYGV